jgi:hypothetical protein
MAFSESGGHKPSGNFRANGAFSRKVELRSGLVGDQRCKVQVVGEVVVGSQRFQVGGEPISCPRLDFLKCSICPNSKNPKNPSNY